METGNLSFHWELWIPICCCLGWFPCVFWDKAKNFLQFQKAVSYFKYRSYRLQQFLTTTVNDPGSTHDAHLLKCIEVFQGISNGNILPNKSINLGEKFGEIPLVTVSDFPRYALLVKGASEAARNEKERLFNETLRSAGVVTKNCYGMFKERWRFLYKKTNVKLHNVKFNVLVCFFWTFCTLRWMVYASHDSV